MRRFFTVCLMVILLPVLLLMGMVAPRRRRDEDEVLSGEAALASVIDDGDLETPNLRRRWILRRGPSGKKKRLLRGLSKISMVPTLPFLHRKRQ